ncbi:MAG: heme lyase CcmF/NrfE family subunit [Chloroflexi bacterium]|nr:heme lyase CcmF/NrfE family subunit [Chloroflexota bacterium]
MAAVGVISLYLALVLAVYALLASLLGRARSSTQVLQSARNAAYLIPGILGLATVVLVAAFLTHDFQFKYVASHSSLDMNPIYTWVAFYAGNEGSLLYVALSLAIFAAIAIVLAPPSLSQSLPYTTAIMMAVLIFFLLVMVTLANPFATLVRPPLNGQGINPLLTHPGMFFHPPMLMSGLIAITVPFSMVMGQMLSGSVGDEWVDQARVWSLVAWAVLGGGLLLGAWWAYTILGWGGFWGWDPIENVALMPWLALTAFVHSIMVQKRRGMFRMWNVVLMNIAFTLALFGVFINRGGPVPSVHSFASSILGWAFLAFLGLSLFFSFGVFFFKYRDLKGMVSLESTLSREAAFLLNNLLLLGVTFVTLWGVVFPLVSQMFQGVTVTVAAPFYNQLNGPILLALLLLMGVGPLLPWRHASGATLWRAVRAPGIAALVVMAVLLVLGVRVPAAVLSFGFCSLVAVSILREWARGVRARHSHGESYPLAFLRLLAANRPRYGGYIVHLSIILLVLGVTGSIFYGVKRDVNLAPGDTVRIKGYTVQFLGARTVDWRDRTEYFNDMLVTLPTGKDVQVTAWRAFYPDQNIGTTRAAIRSTPLEDLYIVTSESLGNGRVVFRILVNPLVWWMWLAGLVFIVGTLIALWPQREVELAFAPSGQGMTPAPAGMDPWPRS